MTSSLTRRTPEQAASARRTQHFTHDLDFSREQLLRVLELAGKIKDEPERYTGVLHDQYLTLLFEKPSLRTRLTFELAMKQLGGDSVSVIGPIGGREPVKDVARNLDRWTQGIVARVFHQTTIEELTQWTGIPVVNALSDVYHPCQALADAQTLKEHFGQWDGLTVTYVGDGNNVAHSLMLTLSRLGVRVRIASPKGYEPKAEVLEQARELGEVSVSNDPVAAVQGADAVYADVWASMGQEQEAEVRRGIFLPFQVNEALMEQAGRDAAFMHCLPAHRGEEVTDGVIESPRSLAFDQAENRLHAQKALLVELLA